MAMLNCSNYRRAVWRQPTGTTATRPHESQVYRQADECRSPSQVLWIHTVRSSALLLVGSFLLACDTPVILAAEAERQEVLVYYANETAPDAAEAANYATIKNWLESSDLQKARTIAQSLTQVPSCFRKRSMSKSLPSEPMCSKENLICPSSSLPIAWLEKASVWSLIHAPPMNSSHTPFNAYAGLKRVGS